MPKYKRVLLKISGEALSGEDGVSIDQKFVDRLAKEIKEVKELGVELAIVIGGGNFFRGRDMGLNIEEATGHSMGMLATVMNALALRDIFKKANIAVRAMSAIFMPKICDLYCKDRAEHHLAKDRVIVIGGGTGNSFFSTDTAAALYAVELGCDVLLKATKVDGVYTADPQKDKTATKHETISHQKALVDELEVMDGAAMSLCKEHKIHIRVFNLLEEGNIKKVILGEAIGTLVC